VYPVKNEQDRAGMRKGYDEIPILTTATPPKTDRDFYKYAKRRNSVLDGAAAANGTAEKAANGTAEKAANGTAEKAANGTTEKPADASS